MLEIECPCPSCGFYTTGSTYFGSYSICILCDWEDDGVQLANPASGGGANKISLIESQEIAIQAFPVGIERRGAFLRDSNWRPLKDNEKLLAKREKEMRHWSNNAVVDYWEAYWMAK